MVGKAGLKAGLIGVAVMLVVTVLNNVLPISGAVVYVVCGLSVAIYAGIGVLAGLFVAAPRTAGKGAAAGAIAGAICAVIAGAIGSGIMFFRMARGLGVPGLSPQQMQLLAESNIDPKLYAIPGAVCGLAINTIVATIGGAVVAAVKTD